ncbi:sensor histidine kinase [Paenibacillus sp. FSL H8-0548]|uniref:cache domain-containing sensor histidine kinase n=1 Tax=Paenibacillus sp. FSL H8-0548 TaxID=1920422 RepID=UPI00096EF3E1|nr:sensor histidine kinase [Paenibacillus sp. FSL H8-0548]OMF37857.1 sensor histidine kinase [Paenibacillus sp. FSL H8-0548]
MNKIILFLRHTFLDRTIVRTILLSYLLVNVLLLLLLGYLSIKDSTKMITDEIIHSSNKVMEQAALGLSFNLEESKRSLVMLAGNYSVITMMKENNTIAITNRLQHERNIAEISQGVSTYQTLISDVLMLGKTGYVNNLDGRKTLQWDYPFQTQPWVQETFQTNPQGSFFSIGVHKQDYYLSTNITRYNQPSLSVVLQVKGYQGQVLGAVIANLDLSKINGMFEQSTYQNKGSIFLIDENRKIIVHKDSSKIGQTLDFPAEEKLYEQPSGHFTEKIDRVETLVIYQPTAVAGWKMLSTVPMSDITSQSQPLKSNLGRILYVCLIANTLISLLITLRISLPVRRLLAALDRMGEDDSLYVKPRDYRYRELNYIGNKFKDLMGRIDLLIKQNYLTQISLKEEELKTLQAQINPHFLFNTLQQLQTEIVCGNTTESNHIVLSLSNLFRYSMKRSEEEVELEREINNVSDYLYILNKKYNNGIAVSFHIPNRDVLRCKIPKLTLQPIVENSIRHGFGDHVREGKLQILAVSGRKGLLIVISDNGQGMESAKVKTLSRHINSSTQKMDNIGLYNVSQRIKLKYGNEYGIQIHSRQAVGTRISILLPNIN